ncbi:MAG: carboxymuconolactone decarboxylase family protein [Pseudobdellovibrionaceae bacterium]
MNHLDDYSRLQKLIGSLGKQIPGPIAGFLQMHQKSVADGVLSKKTKELMALSIAICSKCEGCVTYHVHDSIRAGASREEVLETIGVAIMMGGGPALIYACEALEALDDFEGHLHDQDEHPRETSQPELN